MINPALKAALLKWEDAARGCEEAERLMDDVAYGMSNTNRIAALEEIRKMVEAGEFDAAPSHELVDDAVED